MHKRGERREYFESLNDVWEMFSIIAAERKRRELDPVLETIRQCKAMLDEQTLGKAVAKHANVAVTRERLAHMEEFMTVTNKIFQQFVGNAKSGLDAGGEGAAEGPVTAASAGVGGITPRPGGGCNPRAPRTRSRPKDEPWFRPLPRPPPSGSGSAATGGRSSCRWRVPRCSAPSGC